jgi:hypothetical protein
MNPKTTRELLPEQRIALLKKIRESHAYLKAYADMDFMGRKDLRAVRLQLELLKPELILRENKIRSTIVVFGSARILSGEEARRELLAAQENLAERPRDVELKRLVAVASKKVELSHWYEEARRFSTLLSKAQQAGQDLEHRDASPGTGGRQPRRVGVRSQEHRPTSPAPRAGPEPLHHAEPASSSTTRCAR